LSDFGVLYPLEMVIAATPLSLGASARSRVRWKRVVQDAAKNEIDTKVDAIWLDNRPLALTIFYFPPAPMHGDVDNIVKPIMDALKGFAYLDDRSIERVVVAKVEPDADWTFEQPSEQLAIALDIAPPVVYIRVDDGLEWRAL